MDEKRHLWGVDSTMTGYTHIRKAHCMFGWDWVNAPDMEYGAVYPLSSQMQDVYLTFTTAKSTPITK